MEVKTFEQLIIWLGMQFPVLAAAAVIAWRVVETMNRKHDAEIERLNRQHKDALTEKDKQIEHRDAQLRELKADKEKLMGLHFPSWSKGAEGGGPKS